MFGAYSTLLLVPSNQIKPVPAKMTKSMDTLAALPAVAGTAIHALSLAGALPQQQVVTKVKSVLIHSAAGGVGSMLVQMCKLVNLGPIVAVVGSKHKIKSCLDLGADFVIDKSSQNLWKTAREISPDGYAAIFDANGVETLSNSYEHLARCGRLVIYGFHTNIPKASSILSPLSWFKMLLRMVQMPRFDPMALVLESKSVAGFNLSFFADERELIDGYLRQLLSWIEADKLKLPQVTTFQMHEIDRAHELIQSGNSIGKIIIKT